MVNQITYTQDVLEIDPNQITISKIPVSDLYDILKHTSKATTRPAPGRKFGYAVWHDEALIGVMGISSPVINLGVRDDYLNFPKDPSEKGTVLRNYVDLSTCVGLQPISWYWNIGKLIAMLATSRTVSEQYRNHYGDELKGIVTTSINGKGVQYNRVYKFLGYTKGYGHEHISDKQYHEMLDWMRNNNVEIPSSRFGAGSNPRMRRIAAYNKAKGIKSSMNHGKKRGVYYSPCTNEPIEKIVKKWYDRWGKPRYERVKENKPPYKNGLE